MMSNTEIYAVEVDFTIGPETFAAWYALLPEVRKAKVEFYRFHREKVVALATGLLMRWCLEQRLCRSLEADELAVDQFGKPFLQGNSGIHFNVSHAGAYVVCAVSGQGVGIDIEEMKDGDFRKIACLAFSSTDYTAWEVQPAEGKLDYFYRLWTLRESLSKAVGLGFSLDAKGIYFSQADDLPDTCRVNLTGGAGAEVWYCRHYHCFKGYKLALCLQEAVFPERIKIMNMEALC